MFLFGTRRAWLVCRPYAAVPLEGGAAASPNAAAQNSDATDQPQLPAAGLFEQVTNALGSARVVISSFLELVSLEARRAGLALMWLVAWGLVSAICFVTAWLGLMAALAIWAISLGQPPVAVVIVVALLNLVVGAALIKVCIGISRDLMFTSTRRQIAGPSSARPSP